jgi:hypothetical protein
VKLVFTDETNVIRAVNYRRGQLLGSAEQVDIA